MSKVEFEEEEESTEEGGAPAWVVTFGDMMSLLLTFFVLLLSFSEVDAVKYRALSESLREAFGIHRGQTVFNNPTQTQQKRDARANSRGELFDSLKSIIPQAFPGAMPSKDDGEGTIVRVPGALLFESGKAQIKPEMLPSLRQMADLLKEKTHVVLQVEGHTDDVPINTVRFASNWELSAGRAIAVIRFFIDEAVPAARLSAAGYADSRPLVPNDNPQTREKNRRVEFRFVENLKSK
jgi:chemotaxis protein MotB